MEGGDEGGERSEFFGLDRPQAATPAGAQGFDRLSEPASLAHGRLQAGL